jgi:hypothetical protein
MTEKAEGVVILLMLNREPGSHNLNGIHDLS